MYCIVKLPGIGYFTAPVKNVTWILKEIPCHFMSQLDLVAVWSKLSPNSMTIPCHLSSFICFPCGNMTWILDKFKSWNFHGICQENDGTSIGFGVIFEPNQTAVKKTWENPFNIFYREIVELWTNFYFVECRIHITIVVTYWDLYVF